MTNNALHALAHLERMKLNELRACGRQANRARSIELHDLDDGFTQSAMADALGGLPIYDVMPEPLPIEAYLFELHEDATVMPNECPTEPNLGIAPRGPSPLLVPHWEHWDMVGA